MTVVFVFTNFNPAGKLDTEDGNDREALTKLFMRLDANSDGSVNWDEFSSYMLLEGTTQQVSSYATKNAVMFGAPQVGLMHCNDSRLP